MMPEWVWWALGAYIWIASSIVGWYLQKAMDEIRMNTQR